MPVADDWKRMVLRATPPPAWLSDDSPDADVCLSSRARIMRNLRGHRFPHHASVSELREISAKVLAANQASLHLEALRGIGPAERDALVSARLISHGFSYETPGRAVLLDGARRISVMVNEEDHVRLQALCGGWSAEAAWEAALRAHDAIAEELEFAWSPRFGYLAASPYNCGTGVRCSAMFHLMALAATKRLPKVLRALGAMDVAARGLYGEASKAVGAFVQISVTTDSPAPLRGAAEVLIREERLERARLGRDMVLQKVDEARTFAIAGRTVSLANALRVLGWFRLGAAIGGFAAPASPKEVDAQIARLDLFGSGDASSEARRRAELLRGIAEGFQLA